MQIIIDQDGKRIKIVGEMQIYGYGPDLLNMAEQIKRQVEENKIDYGWVKIDPAFTYLTPTPKQKPPPEPTPEKPKMVEWTK